MGAEGQRFGEETTLIDSICAFLRIVINLAPSLNLWIFILDSRNVRKLVKLWKMVAQGQRFGLETILLECIIAKSLKTFYKKGTKSKI